MLCTKTIGEVTFDFKLGFFGVDTNFFIGLARREIGCCFFFFFKFDVQERRNYVILRYNSKRL